MNIPDPICVFDVQDFDFGHQTGVCVDVLNGVYRNAVRFSGRLTPEARKRMIGLAQGQLVVRFWRYIGAL